MKYSLLIFSAFNIFIWHWVIVGGPVQTLDAYFLDVGQGDGSLIVLPGGPKILIDGGPDKNIVGELDKILSPTDRYIDLVILSHVQLDHFGGLIAVLGRYEIGAFIYNGRDGEIEAWQDLVRVLNNKKIPVLVLGEGDKIIYAEDKIDFLSPDEESINKELNETALVAKVEGGGVKLLFTGDIGFNTENYLKDKYDIDVDVLKVAHHGSKYSSGAYFLAEATPAVSVVQVGKNTYGHPTEVALNRLAQVGSSIYRNDKQGTVHIKAKDGFINVFGGQ